ncbi:hypothetical protein TYRP_008433 [Tyrophagus putrescentiae]|nr:hypothetical protein TYRP_008433 [Tyrophagus putrescentiae]
MSPKRRLRSSSQDAQLHPEVGASKSPSPNTKVILNLKKLGITNVIDHLKTTNLNEVNGLRKTRSSINPSETTPHFPCEPSTSTKLTTEEKDAARATPGKGRWPGSTPKTTRKPQNRVESELTTMTRKKNNSPRGDKEDPPKQEEKSKLIEIEMMNGHGETESEDSQQQNDGMQSSWMRLERSPVWRISNSWQSGHLSNLFITKLLQNALRDIVNA